MIYQKPSKFMHMSEEMQEEERKERKKITVSMQKKEIKELKEHIQKRIGCFADNPRREASMGLARYNMMINAVYDLIIEDRKKRQQNDS